MRSNESTNIMVPPRSEDILTRAICGFMLVGGFACSSPPEEVPPESADIQAQSASARVDEPLDAVVATIEGRQITTSALHKFTSTMPEKLQSREEGPERARNHLQTLIDREMLIIEAQARGIDQSRSFVKTLNKVKRERVVSIFQAREVQLEMDPAEFEQFVADEEHDRAIRFSEIIVGSKEEAERVVADIASGRNFADLARERSMSTATAENGGDRGRFSVKVEIDPVFRDGLFSLGVGETSGPLKFSGRLWVVVRVTDEKKVQLGQMPVQEILKEFQQIKFREARRKLADELGQKYELRLDRSGVDVFLSKTRNDSVLSPADEDGIVLYTFNDGKITAGNLVEVLQDRRQRPGALQNADEVITVLKRFVVPDALFMAGAVRAGIDREKAIVTWLDDQRKWLLIVELRSSFFAGQLEVSREEAQAHFQENKATFADPALIIMDEILVASEEEAGKIRAEIERGSTFASLAERSMRPLDHRDEQSRVELYAFEKAAWGGLDVAAKKATIGDLMGPVEMEDGYSVFRVLSRDRRQVSFDEVERRVVATVKWLRKQRLFETEIEELRRTYASRVEIDEDVLASVVKASVAASAATD